MEGKKVFILSISSEIGKGIYEKLSSHGYDVYGSYNQNLPSSINREKLINIDLNNSSSIENSKDFFEKHTFYSFINCAGVNIAGPLIGIDDDQIDSQLDINLTGPIKITKFILKNMIRKKEGHIIHLGSVSSHRCFRGHSGYSASKAGLEGFVRALASEVAKRGIKVNCILPGPVMSPMLEKSIEETGMDPKINIPTEKLVEKEEIAEFCSFLLSNKCPSITGATIPIDGGYMLW